MKALISVLACVGLFACPPKPVERAKVETPAQEQATKSPPKTGSAESAPPDSVKTVADVKASAETAQGFIGNEVPYDGCSWYVEIAGTQYALDEASTKAAIDFTASAMGKTAAKITFARTGKKGVVQCGWGTTKSLDEIHVTAFAK
jgi:hypothetical protein